MPELPRTLLADLENNEHVMMEHDSEKARLKKKAATARPDKGKLKSGASGGGSSNQVPKKACTEKFFQLCKTHGGTHQTHNEQVSPFDMSPEFTVIFVTIVTI